LNIHIVDAIFWSGDVASSEMPTSPASWPAKPERSTGSWPAGPPPTIKSVKCLYREERSPRDNRSSFNNFDTPFLYSCMPYAYFALVKHETLCGRLIYFLTWFDWFHKYWRLPATKVIVRGPIISGVRNPTRRANLTPPWVGEEYSLTHTHTYIYIYAGL